MLGPAIWANGCSPQETGAVGLGYWGMILEYMEQEPYMEVPRTATSLWAACCGEFVSGTSYWHHSERKAARAQDAERIRAHLAQCNATLQRFAHPVSGEVG